MLNSISSIYFWRWYVNIAFTVLDIVHSLFFYLQRYIFQIGICLRRQEKSMQLDQMDRASLSLSLSPVTSSNSSKVYKFVIAMLISIIFMIFWIIQINDDASFDFCVSKTSYFCLEIL
jgi:hypothetical protein